MTRSRFTAGLRRPNAAARARDHRSHVLRRLPLASAISAILAGGVPAAHAVTAAETENATLEEVVVTAQKRTENLQSVPISIEVLSGAQLQELNVGGLDGYVKYSPSIAYSRGDGQGGNGQPGTSHIYMRGVVSTANENHTGSQPTVGTYFDEQPVTTIDGTPDIHLYDIQRIEVLEGPQGTLYGASSEAGTVRIITNKPDPTKFSASYDVQMNRIGDGGAFGYGAEAYANMPITDALAVRLVGFYEKTVATSATWREQTRAPVSSTACAPFRPGLVKLPAVAELWPRARPALSSAPERSAIAATSRTTTTMCTTRVAAPRLKWDINDNWSVTPSAMVQSLSANGFFGYDPGVGDLKLAHFGPETLR